MLLGSFLWSSFIYHDICIDVITDMLECQKFSILSVLLNIFFFEQVSKELITERKHSASML